MLVRAEWFYGTAYSLFADNCTEDHATSQNGILSRT
jgi:hypothetical protein